MSSSYVRDTFETFLKDNSAENYIIDLTGEIDPMDDMLARYSVPRRTGWVGLTYIADDETPESLSATNSTGCYREIGGISVHVVEVAQLGVAKLILPRAEALRDLIRGRNIGGIRVQTVTPPNFERGATLDFEGGFVSATIEISYERDLNL